MDGVTLSVLFALVAGLAAGLASLHRAVRGTLLKCEHKRFRRSDGSFWLRPCPNQKCAFGKAKPRRSPTEWLDQRGVVEPAPISDRYQPYQWMDDSFR